MNRKRLRVVLVEQEKRLVDLHRATGISYNRLIRVVNGYSEPSEAEVTRIASVLGVQPSELLNRGYQEDETLV